MKKSARLKRTDMVVCPVCLGAGMLLKSADELGTLHESCPHGREVTYEKFLWLRLPHEKAKRVNKVE